MPETLVLLHGFAGTHRAWDGVVERLERERYRPLALDLPGHGERPRDAQAPIAFESAVERVLDAAPERFALCGYSLGGRVALHVALAAPRRVARLVLVACDPGIEDADERAARLDADRLLAGELESGPFEEVLARWNAQALFAADPPHVTARAKEDQLRNDPLALAEALRGLSVGAMAPLWGRLGELTMPVAFVAGERDEKFTAIGRRLVEVLPGAKLLVLPGGHRLALESPGALATVLQRLHAETGPVR